jgi:hypothetical protein
MLKGTLRTGVAFFCGMAVLALGMALSDDHKHDQGDHGMPDMSEMSPEEQQMMEAWMKYGSPNEMHEHMVKGAGKWNVVMNSWMAPGAEMETYKGMAVAEPIMGGRFLKEKFTAEWDGMPMEGMSLMGYDIMAGKYCSVWIDNWSTGIFYSEGTADENGVIHMTTKHPNVMTGEYEEMRMEIHHTSEDMAKMMFFVEDGEGGWHKNMEMIYTRADDGGKSKIIKTHK